MGRANYASTFVVTLTRIGVSVVLKFMLGSDDLVWLAPFMARAKKVREKCVVGAKYTCSVLFLTLLACALAMLIHAAARRGESNDDRVDEIVATVAAGLLMTYAVYMAHDEGYFDGIREQLCGPRSVDAVDAPLVENDHSLEYGTMKAEKHDDREDDDDELGPLKRAVMKSLLEVNECVDAACSCCARTTKEGDLEEDEDEEADDRAKADNSVVIVAFLGSMDDFMVYFTLALSSQLAWYELSIGITIGAILIAVVVATLLQSSERIAACVEKIPVPLILGGLAVFILVAAWTRFDGL